MIPLREILDNSLHEERCLLGWYTLMKQALSSSETSVLARAARCNIPKDTVFIDAAVKT
jgi:hypothetical protein